MMSSQKKELAERIRHAAFESNELTTLLWGMGHQSPGFREHTGGSNYARGSVRHYIDTHKLKHNPEFYTGAAVLWLKGYDCETTGKRLGVSGENVREYWQELGFPQTRFTFPPDEQRRENLTRCLEGITQDEIKVMMGTTPTGDIHLANMRTLAGGAYLVKQACERIGKKPIFTLGFNDNLESVVDTPQVVASRRQKVVEFLEELRKEYGIEMAIQDMSALQKDPGFRQVVRGAADRGFFAGGPRGRLQYWSKENQRYYNVGVGSGGAHVLGDEYDLRFDLQTTIELRAVHGNVDVYVIGGDQDHGDQLMTTAVFRGIRPPHTLRMGVVYGADGNEMHAKDGNGISIDQLREGNPDWVKQIVKLADSVTFNIGPFDYFPLLPKTATHLYGVPLTHT